MKPVPSAAHAVMADIRSGYPTLDPDPDYPPLRLRSIRAEVSAVEWAARVDCACAYRLVRHFGMAGRARELEHRRLVAFKPEPAKPIENRLDRGFGRTGAVGILDPQKIRATMATREEPVKQRRACATNVEIARG